MPHERVEFGVARTKCNCSNCVANCECIPGYLIPSDLEPMIPPDVAPAAWAREHLRASSGATIVRIHTDGRREVIHIPTLVPAHHNGLACHWLKQGRCEIHAIAPFGCAFFDCHQSERQVKDLSAQGIREVEDAHDKKGLYSRLWSMLWEEGLRAPSAMFKREALDAHLKERQRRRTRNWLRPRRHY